MCRLLKYFTGLLMLMLILNEAPAQDELTAQGHQNYISFGMGRLSPTRIETMALRVGSIVENVAEGLIYLATWESVELGDDIDIGKITYSGVLFFDYRHMINEDIMLGGIFAYEKNTSTLSGSVNGEYAISNYVFAAEGAAVYANKPKFKLYSGGGLGFKTQNHSYSPDS